MGDSLQPIRIAIQVGDTRRAQNLLRPILKAGGSAEAWTLAAQVCPTPERAIQCLRRALEIDPYYLPADRLLLKLEGGKPSHIDAAPRPKVELTRDELKKLKKARPRRRIRLTTVLTWLCVVLFAASFTLFTLNLIGVVSGVVTQITVFTGGPTPVAALDGVPLAQVDDAPMKIAPSLTKEAITRDTNVLDPGYTHEYHFQASRGEQIAIYVQFLSFSANRVRRNVVILEPDGDNGTRRCEYNTILQGDNNVAYICTIHEAGTWKVRVLGREGESVGAYFVGVERLAPL